MTLRRKLHSEYCFRWKTLYNTVQPMPVPIPAQVTSTPNGRRVREANLVGQWSSSAAQRCWKGGCRTAVMQRYNTPCFPPFHPYHYHYQFLLFLLYSTKYNTRSSCSTKRICLRFSWCSSSWRPFGGAGRATTSPGWSWWKCQWPAGSTGRRKRAPGGRTLAC